MKLDFRTKEPINKGWSGDKKYCVTDETGTKYLLRVSDIAEYDAKKAEFNGMKQVAALGVPMCEPISGPRISGSLATSFLGLRQGL